MKIDALDKKILYHLDLNSRQSLSAIEAKTGAKKNVIAYRINRLRDDGVIKSFFTIVNPFTFGYSSYGFYLVYQYASPEIQQQIVDFFVQHKCTWFVASIEGEFDLGVSLWIKNLEEFYGVWKDTLEHFRRYIKNHKFINYVQTRGYPHTYLLDTPVRENPQEIVYIGGAPQVAIDTIDLQLLQILSKNARAPATVISQQIKTSPTVVSYRLKKLESLGVIQNYTIALDIPKIGYSDFRIDLDLADFKQRDAIIQHLLKFPSLTYVFTSIGHSDIQFNVRVTGIDDVHVILNQINTSFPDGIRDYKYIHIPKIFKQNYMPLP